MITEETIATLDSIDRRFYRDGAAAFAKKREQPWPGWARVLAGGGSTVLDAGCGHGRFYAALDPSIQYTGIDRSAELLGLARARYGDRFRQADLIADPIEGRYDLVVAFGVLHHVPGERRRRALIDKLHAAVAPGGRLALTFWRFAEEPRFRSKMKPWSTIGLAPSDVEPGDHLLTFEEQLRYAHHFDDAEVDRLVGGHRVLDDFRSDGEGGALNRYVIIAAR